MWLTQLPVQTIFILQSAMVWYSINDLIAIPTDRSLYPHYSFSWHFPMPEIKWGRENRWVVKSDCDTYRTHFMVLIILLWGVGGIKCSPCEINEMPPKKNSFIMGLDWTTDIWQWWWIIGVSAKSCTRQRLSGWQCTGQATMKKKNKKLYFSTCSQLHLY